MGQKRFGYFRLGRHSGFSKVTRCKSGTASSRTAKRDMHSVNNIPADYQAAIASKLAPTIGSEYRNSIKAGPYKRPAGAYGAGSITGSRPNIKSVNN